MVFICNYVISQWMIEKGYLNIPGWHSKGAACIVRSPVWLTPQPRQAAGAANVQPVCEAAAAGVPREAGR